MADKQPRDFDVVLGGEAVLSTTGAVLGGLEGVKKRWKSSDIKVKLTALSDALNYGDAGFDLIIEALQDSSLEIYKAASELLLEKKDEEGIGALLGCEPWLFFKTLKDWNVNKFNHQIETSHLDNTAYIVNNEQLQLLLQGKEATKVEALIYYFSNDYDPYGDGINEEFDSLVDILFEARSKLKNLKALFIGDSKENKYKKSYLKLGDISLILKAYSNLEVFHIRGYCNELDCEKLQHDNLKTLIVETANISDVAIYRLCSLKLPALEYFELWMGKGSEHNSEQTIDSLKPILFSESFPNLKYLGLRSSEYADAIASAIAQSSFMAEFPIIEELEVLDLSMGSLTDEGLETLIECQELSNLHTLNISSSCISEEFIMQIKQMSQLDYLLITHSQEKMSDPRRGGYSRYYALHE